MSRTTELSPVIARSRLRADDFVEAWNDSHPIGTRVRYWPAWPPTKDDPVLETTTASSASLSFARPFFGEAVVNLNGVHGCVSLSRVDVLEEGTPAMPSLTVILSCLGACVPAIEWSRCIANKHDHRAALAACPYADWLLWLAQKSGVAFGLLALATAAFVKQWINRVSSSCAEVCLEVVKTAEAYGRGEISTWQRDGLIPLLDVLNEASYDFSRDSSVKARDVARSCLNFVCALCFEQEQGTWFYEVVARLHLTEFEQEQAADAVRSVLTFEVISKAIGLESHE